MSELDDLKQAIDQQNLMMRQLLLTVRQMLLGMVDGLERYLGISPRTSELRKTEKHTQ